MRKLLALVLMLSSGIAWAGTDVFPKFNSTRTPTGQDRDDQTATRFTDGTVVGIAPYVIAVPGPGGGGIGISQGDANNAGRASNMSVTPTGASVAAGNSTLVLLNGGSSSASIMTVAAGALMPVAPTPTATWFVVNTAASGGLTVSPAPSATWVLGAGTATIGGVTLAQGPAGSVTILTPASALLPVAPTATATWFVVNSVASSLNVQPTPTSTWAVTMAAGPAGSTTQMNLVFSVPASNTSNVASVTVTAPTVPSAYGVSEQALASNTTGATLYDIAANVKWRLSYRWAYTTGAAGGDITRLVIGDRLGRLVLTLVPPSSINDGSVAVLRLQTPWLSYPIAITIIEVFTVTGSSHEASAFLEVEP